jgi:hypothetical protein
LGNRTPVEIRLVKKLVSDCISFNLKPAEAMMYIEKGLGKPISMPSYSQYRTKLQSEATAESWLRRYTRIQYVIDHRQMIDDAEKVYHDSMNRFFIESLRTVRNERLIMAIKYDIREHGRYLNELRESTPIVASIKAQIDAANKILEGGVKGNGQKSSDSQQGDIQAASEASDPWI